MRLPNSRTRVAVNTSAPVNRRIENEMEARVRYYAKHRGEIPGRMQALDREWDIERAIEANASALALAGIALGARVDRRWLAVPAAVSAFLFQHAIQGWCPPVPILRRLGFRTVSEIERERRALQLLRGGPGNRRHRNAHSALKFARG